MVSYSFKRMFVTSIKIGLGLEPADPEVGARGPKRQTIRANGKRRHARPGDDLQLYCGMRTTNCFLIGRALCIDSRPISLHLEAGEAVIIADDGEAISYKGRGVDGGLDLFARMDGFADWDTLVEFWRVNHPGVRTFNGTIIYWDKK